MLTLLFLTCVGVSADEIRVDHLLLRLDATGRLVAMFEGKDTPQWLFPPDTLELPSSGPVMREDQSSVWYGWGYYLFALNGQTGQVIERILLCDRVHEIVALKEDGLNITLKYGDKVYPVIYRQGHFEPQIVSTLSVQTIKEAMRVASDRFQFEDWIVELIPLEARDDQLIDRYEAARQIDPTNPWLLVLQGMLLKQQGHSQEAERLWDAALRHPLSDGFQRLLMGFTFEGLRLVEWADRAYELAYAAYLQEGYEPEVTMTLVSPPFLIRKVAAQNLKEGRIDRVIALIDSSRRFAPFVDGDYMFNLAFSRWLERHARIDQAKATRVLNRNLRHRSTEFFGLSSHLATWSDLMLLGWFVPGLIMAFSTCCWAIRYRTYVQSLRRMREQVKRLPLRQRLRLYSIMLRHHLSWSLVHVLFGMTCGAFLFAAVLAIGKWADTEIVWGDHLGHPRMVTYFQQRLQARPSAAARFTYAYACQLGGRFEEARRQYQTLLAEAPFSGRAFNNLGVIAFLRGDAKTAEQNFKQAYQQNPRLVAAAYNLRLTTQEGHWLNIAHTSGAEFVKRQQIYRPGQPMVAPAQVSERLEAILGARQWYHLAPGVIGALLRGKSYSLFKFFSAPESKKPVEVRRTPSLYFMLAVVILVVLLLQRFFSSEEPVSRLGQSPSVLPQPIPDTPRPSIWYGLIPGSYQAVGGHSVAGSILFGLTVFGLMERWCFWRLGAPGIMTAIGIPGKLVIDFGEPLKVVLQHEDFIWRVLDRGSLWLVLCCFVVNLLWVAIAVRRNVSLKTR